MNTDSLESTEVPLKKLLNWNDNVRTTGAEEGIEELAASIASVGLLQSLVVRKEPRGKFAVVAGRRRLLALSKLAREGTLKTTWPVPCRVAADDADLTEIGLTENVMRVPMIGSLSGMCPVAGIPWSSRLLRAVFLVRHE